MSEWKTKECEPINFDIWIARAYHEHDEDMQLRVLQNYIDEVGFCVSVTDTVFVYSGGFEEGWKIGIRNYPRFPLSREELLKRTRKIALDMAIAGNQTSYMIEELQPVPTTIWYTRRDED